jgi:hypothetical protein
MFRKKRTPRLSPAEENPLARRFRRDAEPDTIDLTQPARFPVAEDAAADPQTAELQTDATRLERLLSRDPETGKLYVHPGSEQEPVRLQEEIVRAPTELRAGDRLRFGSVELYIHAL